ncbi:MAG TPA: hypothetical protein VK550_17770, partial [Polyangiaceae bacterium]|nr:hypothetical protein [Polyangiaceae bacterium]
MSRSRRNTMRLWGIFSLAVAQAAAMGCSGTEPPQRPPAGAGTGGTGGSGGTISPDASIITSGSGGSTPPPIGPSTPDGSGGAGGSSCEKAQCKPPNGQYCGEIGDKCGGLLKCTDPCPSDWACEKNVCVGGPTCTPVACEATGGRFCGTIGNGCGKPLDCGMCPNGDECRSGVCVRTGCVPITCDTKSGRFCGTIGDGCGGTLTCGDCPGGAVCGGGNIPNLCGGPPGCVPIACTAQNGGQYCGVIGNGCGGQLDCGA